MCKNSVPYYKNYGYRNTGIEKGLPGFVEFYFRVKGKQEGYNNREEVNQQVKRFHDALFVL
jgi:hypothetical protein